MRILPFIGAVLALSVFAGEASAQVNPAEAYIKSLSYDGSGCPAGTIGQSISSDRQTFTLIFDQYVATLGPSIPVTENRKNCHVNINLHVPNGFQYAVTSVQYRGYVQLSAGATATQSSTFHFASFTKQATSSNAFAGPVSKDYLVNEDMPLTSVVWSPCGRQVPLNINAQIRLSGGGTSNGQMTTDSMDGKVKHILGIQYRECQQ